MTISDALRRQVIQESNHRCEYCKTSSRVIGMPLVMEHILPKALGGQDNRENLAASCYRCNEFKGARTEAIDPETQRLVPLYHPREQIWQEHFAWSEDLLQMVGLTATGRATIAALKMNCPSVVNMRRLLLLARLHPPE